MTSEAYEKTQRRLQRDRDAEAEQAAYNKAMGNEMFKIALRTPSSEVRNVLMQEKMRLEQQIGSPYVEAVTPEDQAYNFHVLANGIALQSMLELGEISQAMFDRAKRQKLPVDSVRNMLKGLAKGRASQAEKRYKKALLKAVQDVVAVQKPTFETRENLTNDAYIEYMMNVSREDYEMSRRGVASALDRPIRKLPAMMSTLLHRMQLAPVCCLTHHLSRWMSSTSAVTWSARSVQKKPPSSCENTDSSVVEWTSFQQAMTQLKRFSTRHAALLQW